MSDAEFFITFFSTYAATEQRSQKIMLAELAELIRTTDATTKGTLPWLKLAAFGDKRTEANCLRHDGNVRWISGIEADKDAGPMTFDEAVEVATKAGLRCCIYTSPSHTEDAPRWRVVAPLSLGMEPGKRAHLMGRLNGLYGGVFARESWTLSQSYYFGSVAGNPSHRVEVVEGMCLDQLDELDEIWRGLPERAKGGTATEASGDAREDAELIRRVVTGEGFHAETLALTARYIGRGIGEHEVTQLLQGIMLSHPETSRDDRWRDRNEDIGDLVASAVEKFGGEQIEHRRVLCRLLFDLIDGQAPQEVIEASVRAEGERRGVEWDQVCRIARWVVGEAEAA